MVFGRNDRVLKGEVDLPASKSESNRALMMAAYGGFVPCAENLSDAHDTQLLQSLLKQIELGENHCVDCEDAGTVCRFLLTYLAGKKGEWLLTGTPRLRRRPLADLVETLRQLGASIRYVERDGELPLVIEGRELEGGEVCVSMEKSSQFASSLLLAAPYWRRGLTLQLEGEISSLPYLDMTLDMMRQQGAEVHKTGRLIRVENVPYRNVIVNIAADWSAASYWFEAAALSADCDLLLRRLRFDSLQGDKAIADMMRAFGVVAQETPDGIRLRKGENAAQNLVFDFSQTPDLFPAVVATCAGLRREARFVGVRNLALKESDRLAAMGVELRKMGVCLERLSEDVALLKVLQTAENLATVPISFDSHQDHRMAMALSFISLINSNIQIETPEVVQKSYPKFWQEFAKIVG